MIFLLLIGTSKTYFIFVKLYQLIAPFLFSSKFSQLYTSIFKSDTNEIYFIYNNMRIFDLNIFELIGT